MANYATLKAAIADAIKTNGSNAITGALLQSSLLSIIDSLGAGYQFIDVATPTTNPETPDQKVFYIASTPGTYTNFGGLVVNDGEVAILKYATTWSKDVVNSSLTYLSSKRPKIYQDTAAPNYERYVQEVFVVSLPAGNVLLKSFGTEAYLYTKSSGVYAGASLNGVANGDIVPFVVYNTNDTTNYPVGKVVGYAIFSDVSNFLANATTGEGSYIVRGVAENPAFSPIINLALSLRETKNDLIDLSTDAYAQENIAEDKCSFQYETSTFSGWGFTLCSGISIKKLKIKVKNRHTSTTMTKVAFSLYRRRYGPDTLIVSKQVTVSIAPGATSYVECEFDQLVEYNGDVYFVFACDTLVSLFAWNLSELSTYPFVPADNTTYGRHGYKINGDLSATQLYMVNPGDLVPFWVYVTGRKWMSEYNVKQAIDTSIEDRERVDISLPSEICAVVGDTIQLFYKSIFRCVDFTKYDIYATCDIGHTYPRYYEVTPLVANVGTHSLSFTIKDNNNNVIATKQTNLVVYAAGSSPASNINVLCIGASATQDGQWASEFKRRLVGSGGTPAGDGLSNITFVGRKSVTFDGKQVNLEATGGYTFGSYTSPTTARYRFDVTAANEPTISVGDVYSNNGHNYTIVEINISPGSGGYFSCEGTGAPQYSGVLTKVSGTGSDSITYASSSFSGNPFVYDGVIDVQQYADDYCGGTIDVIYTELFGNGSSDYTTNFASRLAAMQTFIDQFRAVFPNVKFCIGAQWNPDVRGGIGVNYGASGAWSHAYGMKFTFMGLLNALRDYIAANNLSGVYICNWMNEFDEENDFLQTTKPVNTRSQVTEIFGVNGIHPSVVGYNQMADSAWRLFVSKFCQ